MASVAGRTTDQRETSTLIGSDKVEGTHVYGADRQQIGTVQRVMIDKITGKVVYAVVSFGGFLGIGEDYFPVPWSTLHYDLTLEGYKTNLKADQLQNAPRYAPDRPYDWSRENDVRVYNHYKAPYYW